MLLGGGRGPGPMPTSQWPRDPGPNLGFVLVLLLKLIVSGGSTSRGFIRPEGVYIDPGGGVWHTTDNINALK